MGWNSTKATTRMWPRIIWGSDEACNRAVTIVLWPLGSLDIWYEPHWRTEGPCDSCIAELTAEGYTEAEIQRMWAPYHPGLLRSHGDTDTNV